MTFSGNASKLHHCRVLIVEDVYFVADDIARALSSAGAKVIGPAGGLDEGLDLARSNDLNVAVLDVNLAGEMSYPIAEVLAERDVPFVFASGYDDWAMPECWQNVPRVPKPYQMALLIEKLAGMVPQNCPT